MLQNRIRQLLEERIARGEERGIQVSVRRHGDALVDLALGTADVATGRPMTPDTPVFCWSMAKGVTATVVNLLIQRGTLTPDTVVAELWPDFGAHGKHGVTLRDVLTHTAGVPAIPMDTTVADMTDHDHMCAVIADAQPWWVPGTQTGYHAYTFGFVIGEIVRRATGRRISDILRVDVAEPLGVAEELFLGVPATQQHLLARLEDSPAPPMNPDDFPPDLPMFRTGPMTLGPSADLGNRPDFLAAEIPAVGAMSARAMTTLYDALLTGRILDAAHQRAAVAPVFTGTDAIFGNEATWGLGYALGVPFEPGEPTLTVFGMGGGGGTHAWGDTATGVSFAFTKNRLDSFSDTPVDVIELVRAYAGSN